jgi:hypothetical protein
MQKKRVVLFQRIGILKENRRYCVRIWVETYFPADGFIVVAAASGLHHMKERNISIFIMTLAGGCVSNVIILSGAMRIRESIEREVCGSTNFTGWLMNVESKLLSAGH